MIYTIYSKINGQIFRIVQTNNIEEQLQENQLYVEGSFDDTKYYIDNKLPVEIPEKPSPYALFNFNTKEWVLNSNLAIIDVSKKRKQLLVSSDWTQIPNNPLSTAQQEVWATYRQELRDIPQQSGYPFNVVWPVAPT
jgi:hypothetical protein